VWQNENDTFLLPNEFDIHGRRVSTAGIVLDTNDIVIARDTSVILRDQILPSVSFDGNQNFVTWLDRRIKSGDWHNYNLYGARVDPDGTVLDTLGIPISTRIGPEYRPSIATNGADYLIIWRRFGPTTNPLIDTQYDILGARIDGGGAVLDSLPISISNSTLHQKSPDLAFDGNNALVTWSEGYFLWDGRVPGVRINPSGNLVDPIPFPIFQYDTTVSFERDHPAISFDGTKHIVISGYSGTSETEASHVETSGFVSDTFSIPVGRYNRAITSDGTNHLILWNKTLWGKNKGLLIDPNGNPLDSFLLTTFPSPVSYHPAVAFDGTNYLAVWLQYDIIGMSILAGRITSDGIPLDSLGILVSEFGTTDFLWNSVWSSEIFNPLSLAFDGSQYLVVWEDTRIDSLSDNTNIYGSRIAPDGTVLDTLGIPISTETENQLNPSVTFDGNNFFVVWEDHRNGFADIYGTEVNSSGQVLDPVGILISEGDYPNRLPELVNVGGGRSLVVYQSFRPEPDGTDRIYGRIFESSVGVEEEKPFPISQFRLFQNRPNPFIGSTNLSFNLPFSNFVSLKIYDISGRLVKEIIKGKKKAGFYSVKWDGKDEKGKNLSSGIYFYRLHAGDNIDSRKMILLK
jgi:hypothetical protein